MIEISPAMTSEQLDQVRNLIRAFVKWHRARHQEDLELIDSYFDAKAFEEELENLQAKYSPPDGQLLLALYDQQPAGCVALRRIDYQTCEMKRMFVDPQFHGKGVGRALAQAIIRDARALGYSLMRLDTSIRQIEAQTLYQRLGFKQIQPYYPLSDDLRNWLVFMELSLS